MTLSTVDASGDPDARVLILKGVDGAGWHFPLEAESESEEAEAVEAVDGPARSALERWWGPLPARFAELVAGGAEHTATRAFFTRRADAWEERFAYQTPAYEAAVARMGLRRGQTAVDPGCGTGRAMPARRAHVGAEGTVLGLDVTHAMLTAAARIGRATTGGLLLADCARLPLRPASVPGMFAAGLLDHLPRPRTALREWARVTAPGGTLLLHPAGRAERAARHGRPPSPEDRSPSPTSGRCSTPRDGGSRRTTTPNSTSPPWPSSRADRRPGQSKRSSGLACLRCPSCPGTAAAASGATR
ncbi:class I SAM-dependent methyltransferase [Streptomyces sp. NBC_01233]|uniref:class I SAM-dependent methyltransferase n=1 Tax=Streptomyces sp. NBC_01233 TaxID=2903787 RepID=UPI002E118D8E|nr:methyltransferase domain-containing protein [Streptomyces sp. NBC_01233]